MEHISINVERLDGFISAHVYIIETNLIIAASTALWIPHIPNDPGTHIDIIWTFHRQSRTKSGLSFHG